MHTDDDMSATNKPGRRHEEIDPPRKPGDHVIYIQEKGAINPVVKAEQQLQNLSIDFETWLHSIIAELNQSWSVLKVDSSNPAAYLRFHRAAYTIKGDAGILGCALAGEIAVPLTRLLEHTPNIAEHVATFDLFVSTICICTSAKHKKSLAFKEIRDGLEIIIDRKIEKLR